MAFNMLIYRGKVDRWGRRSREGGKEGKGVRKDSIRQ
jgi:hypothetical protein